MAKLRLYRMDMKYVRDLARVDENVMSVSPQVEKSSRPFVGVVVVNGDRNYCIPLSSPKPKHEHMRNGRDFTKVFDPKGRFIAVLNFNNMIPVDYSVIRAVDLRAKASDKEDERAYKALMRNQVEWCNAHADEIVRKANKLYDIVTERPEQFHGLVRRCCDFRRLESVLDSRDGNAHRCGC
ncbi:MAG: type III toxin-antitoxin system ToxN/AbiQ family toxin [Atopobiaceae bacterium]|nr:type III toxin-antitoxin system ToxN/AbiQ family toxin [Atopobiaceae bacterium]